MKINYIYCVEESGYDSHQLWAIKSNFEEAKEYILQLVDYKNAQIIEHDKWAKEEGFTSDFNLIFTYDKKSPYWNMNTEFSFEIQRWVWRSDSSNDRISIVEYPINSGYDLKQYFNK